MKKKLEEIKPLGGQIVLLCEDGPRVIMDTITGYRDSEAVEALVVRWIREGMNDMVTVTARKSGDVSPGEGTMKTEE